MSKKLFEESFFPRRHLLAFSGGPDSVYLLKQLHSFYKESLPQHVELAYVNYHDSPFVEEEEKIVLLYQERYGLVLHQKDVRREECEGNFEDWARKIRYSFFRQLLSSSLLDDVLTAHHQDDSIETYLLQKERGNLPLHYGLDEKTEVFGYPLLRPLLSVTKAEIYHFLQEEKLPYFILGNGSNLLVSDKGYRGAVIQLWKNVSDIQVEGCLIQAKAGASLAKIAAQALEAGLTGMEFAAGIPGTLGGAVVMNAGAYGGEMKDILKEALVMDGEGRIFTLTKEELKLGYRTSIVKEKGYIVLAAVLELQPGDREEIRKLMEDLKQRRGEKQPLDMPSAGSTFKRPEGYFAGKLIMDAGLRGFSVGGAQVSEKHCGFVVNTGGASASDVLALIREVQKRVREKFGVELETEVKFLGEFEEELCGL